MTGGREGWLSATEVLACLNKLLVVTDDVQRKLPGVGWERGTFVER